MSDFTGPGDAFRHGGPRAVWRWALGHGKARWRRAKKWARRRLRNAALAAERAKWRVRRNAYRRMQRRAHKHHRHPKPHGRGPTTIFDSVSVDGLPDLPDVAYAGYCDGLYRNFAAIKARFGAARRYLAFSVLGGCGHGGDFEPGDMTSEKVVGFVHDRHRAGVKRPIVYSMPSWFPAIFANLNAAGIPRHAYRTIIADPDGVREVPDGHDGKQYRWTRSYDETVVRDDFWD